MIYIFHTSVIACEERSHILGGHKDSTGSTIIERESTGWWLTVRNDEGGHITWPLGIAKPEPLFEKGDHVTITIRRSDESWK